MKHRNILSYAKPYLFQTVAGPLLKLAEAALDLVVPLIVAKIIDVGITAGDTSYIVKYCLLLVLVAFVGLALSLTAQFFCAKAAVGLVAGVRSAVFKRIQAFSYTQLDVLGIPTLITRMTSDMDRLQNGVNMTLRLLLRSPFIVVGAVVSGYFIDVRSGHIMLAAVAALSLVTFAVTFGSAPLYKKVQERLDGVTELTGENLEGVRVIRALTLEEREKREFYRRNSLLNHTQRFAGRVSALLNPVTVVLINAGIIVLIKNGAVSVEAGSLTQGEMVALYNYMAQILIELVKFANCVVLLSRAIACADRIGSVLDIPVAEEEDAAAPDPGCETAVRFDNVSLTYSGAGEAALTDISFTAKKGQTIGIIGGTGSGKTSLVNMIAGFYKATGGDVYVGGANVRECSSAKLLGLIGLVPQKAVLFAGTVRSNLAWGNENATDEEMLRAVKLAQAEEVLGPDGLDKRVEQGGRNLSGGQRQRLTIARALVKKPDILILDDSSSALDTLTDAALRREIAALPGDMTVFIVSQRAVSVKDADKIIVLDDGKTAGIGTHDELMQNCEVYRETVQSQE